MTSLSGPLCKVGKGTRPAVFARTASVAGLHVQPWVPHGPTAWPELQPAHLALLREVSPQRPEGRCGAPTSGLPAPPMDAVPAAWWTCPRRLLGLASRDAPRWCLQGTGRTALPPHGRPAGRPPGQDDGLSTPQLGSAPGQPWVLAAGEGVGGRRLLKAFWKRRLVWVSQGVYERGSGKAGKALLAEGRASTRVQGGVRGRRARPRRGGGPGGGAWTTLALPPLRLALALERGGGSLGCRRSPPTP